MKPRIRNVLGNLTLIVLSLALVFAMAEIAIRIFSPFPSYENELIGAYPDRYDSSLGWAGIPDMKRYMTLREFKIEIRTNDMGFRDDSFQEKLDEVRTQRSKKVMILGDSFAWGWGAQQSQRITEHLAAEADGKLTCFNLGQSGYGTDQEYLLFRQMWETIHPEIVVLLFSENDFLDCSTELNYWWQPKPRFILEADTLRLTNVPVPYDSVFWAKKTDLAQSYGRSFGDLAEGNQPSAQQRVRAAVKPLLIRFHFVNWLRLRLYQLYEPYRLNAADATNATASSDSLKDATQIVLRLLDAFHQDTRRIGSEFIVVLVPGKAQVMGWIDNDRWQQLIASHCRSRGIECLDLLPRFRGQKSAYWRIDPHWNARGHKLAARVLAEDFHRLGWLQSEPE